MGLILCIETATNVCSVALSADGKQTAEQTLVSDNEHAALLVRFIDAVLSAGDCNVSSLGAVAVSMGPGSYTGLRIGVAAAKGLCYSLGIPLIAIPTMQMLALGIKNRYTETSDSGNTYSLCPMIDARRMEVYSGLYNSNLQETREVRAEIIGPESFGSELDRGTIVFGGSGSDKCRSLLSGHPHAVFVENVSLTAADMAAFAEERFKSGKFENIAYFEPFYLKDFIAGKPRVKGLS